MPISEGFRADIVVAREVILEVKSIAAILRLLTTHEITDAAAAWQPLGSSPRAGWYQLRWVIEQLFRVMKSQGLQLEDSNSPRRSGW
jgi:hypothetical protein